MTGASDMSGYEIPNPLPRTVALTDQVLATLLEDDGLPISTMGLLEKLNAHLPRDWDERGEAIRAGRFVAYTKLLPLLNRLTRAGRVEKIKLDGMQSCYWRRPDTGANSTTHNLRNRSGCLTLDGRLSDFRSQRSIRRLSRTGRKPCSRCDWCGC